MNFTSEYKCIFAEGPKDLSLVLPEYSLAGVSLDLLCSTALVHPRPVITWSITGLQESLQGQQENLQGQQESLQGQQESLQEEQESLQGQQGDTRLEGESLRSDLQILSDSYTVRSQ